jgi:4-hydroxy-tetrahydrodipicolinate synthase
MKKVLFSGAATALVTPMTKDGLDLPALDRLIEFQLENGIQALLICGTTGEPSTLTADEWKAAIARTVAAVHGRVPVIAGTGSNSTAHVLELAAIAKELGADAQLCVTPYYNKTTQAGLVAHYQKIADESALPVILYNVPARTGMGISLDALKALAKHDNILALKEAGGDIGRVADIFACVGDDLTIYSGADEMNVAMMSLGAKGTISVLSNICPKETAQMAEACLQGDYKKAAALQIRMMPLIRLLFSEVSPIPVKCALHLMGMMEETLRLPLVPMSAAGCEKLQNEMTRLGFL